MADAELTFTGERLHADDALFGLDLLRHRAAYHETIRIAQAQGAASVLELGSGTGYGTTELAEALDRVVGLDRVAPLASARGAGARFVRADLAALPLAAARFDLVVSFQVIEHLEDPGVLVDAMARLVRPDGSVLVSTPNAAFSDGENPYHVREYRAEELTALLRRRFAEVEMHGVSARGEALAYHEARLARIRRIVALDPLGLRRVLPRAPIEWLFARLAVVVRRSVRADDRLAAVDLGDFPIEPAHPRSLDLFAICRRPRPAA